MILSRSSISRLKLVLSMHSSFSLVDSAGLTFSKNKFRFGSSFDPKTFADPDPPDFGDCPLGDLGDRPPGDLSWYSVGGVRGFGERGNHGCVSSTPSSFIDNFVKLFRRLTLSFAWFAAKSPKIGLVYNHGAIFLEKNGCGVPDVGIDVTNLSFLLPTFEFVTKSTLIGRRK